MRVLGISGSLRRDSHNRRLLLEAAELLPVGVELELYDELKALPPYDEDDDGEEAHPAVERLRDAVDRADAILIATPEYNASIPGQLKHAVDWASRPRGAAAIANKPVAVIGTGTGSFGGVWAQEELRKVLRTAGARVVDGRARRPARTRPARRGRATARRRAPRAGAGAGRRAAGRSPACVGRRSLAPPLPLSPDGRSAGLRPWRPGARDRPPRRAGGVQRGTDGRAPARGWDRVGDARPRPGQRSRARREARCRDRRTGRRSDRHRCPALAARDREAANNRGRSRERSLRRGRRPHATPSRIASTPWSAV